MAERERRLAATTPVHARARPPSRTAVRGPAAVTGVMGLQRSAGNTGVAQLLGRGGAGGGTGGAPGAVPTVQRAPTPLVVSAVTPSVLELGVGKRMTARVTATGSGSAVTWALAGAPTGVTIVAHGRTAEVRSAPAVAGAPVGGASFTITATTTGGTPVASAPVLLVEVTGATFAPVPAFGGPFNTAIGTAAAPLNAVDPNRGGISGNTGLATVLTAPAGRATTITAVGPPGLGVAATTLTPRTATGKQRLRITETATTTALNTDITVNSVPTRVRAFGAQSAAPAGSYGVFNTVLFAASDASGPGSRPIAEIITVTSDQIGIGTLTAGTGTPSLPFSAPANNWTDLNATGNGIDVNQFEGPGVPQLPRQLLLRQQFFLMGWTGTFSTSALSTGTHRRTLLRQGSGHIFRTEQFFPGAAAPVKNDAYAGPPLIKLTNIRAAPTTPGATALAADGVSTANVTVSSTAPTRAVNWSILSGAASAAFTAGAAANPVTAPATVRATATAGRVGVRATDTGFANRRGDGGFSVVAVGLGRMGVAPARAGTGVLTSTVAVLARPGGRVLTFAVDGAAAGAGVTVSPPVVTGSTHTAVVTRPAGFSGSVTVTATDSVLTGKTTTGTIRFK